MVAMHPKSRFNRSGYAFAAGLGFGLMFGIISYITQLVNSLGPGVIMCESCKTVSLYFISGKKTHPFSFTRPSSTIASQPIESLH